MSYLIIFSIACHVDSSQFSGTESVVLCLILISGRIKKANVGESVFYFDFGEYRQISPPKSCFYYITTSSMREPFPHMLSQHFILPTCLIFFMHGPPNDMSLWF